MSFWELLIKTLVNLDDLAKMSAKYPEINLDIRSAAMPLEKLRERIVATRARIDKELSVDDVQPRPEHVRKVKG